MTGVGKPRPRRRWVHTVVAAYALLLLASANLQRTLAELSLPSFLDLWRGPQRLEYRADDGRLLRVEDRRAVAARYLQEVLRATWTTLKIGTLYAEVIEAADSGQMENSLALGLRPWQVLLDRGSAWLRRRLQEGAR